MAVCGRYAGKQGGRQAEKAGPSVAGNLPNKTAFIKQAKEARKFTLRLYFFCFFAVKWVCKKGRRPGREAKGEKNE